MVPAAALKLNLTGIIAECSSRQWVEGFVRGLGASHYSTKSLAVKEDIVESMKNNKLYSRSVFYVDKPGARIVLAMYYPKDKMLFYLK